MLYPGPSASRRKDTFSRFLEKSHHHNSSNNLKTTHIPKHNSQPPGKIPYLFTPPFLYIYTPSPFPLQSPPLPLVIPPILRRRIRRDPKLHNRIPKNRLGDRPLVKPLTRKPQFFARIPHLIVLPLEFVFPLLPLRGLVQFPRAMNRPVPEHAHRTESKRAGGFGVIEGVADQSWQISIG